MTCRCGKEKELAHGGCDGRDGSHAGTELQSCWRGGYVVRVGEGKCRAVGIEHGERPWICLGAD